jgi:arylsulfatase A-like enzyme
MKPSVVRLSLALSVLIVAASAKDATRPNIILILTDDLGWTDAGVYGSDLYETPNIDRLARAGMRFTQAYSACTVCSPTRGAVLTGLYPARSRVTDWIPGRLPSNPKLKIPDWTKHLPLETTTLAERFKAAGYVTANIGKWHLGQEAYYPEKHGFDLNVAGTSEGSPAEGYFAPYKIPTLTEGPDREYLTDRMGTEAVRFVENTRDRPFFLYLPHFAVHTPIQGPPALVEKYKAKLRPGLRHTNASYAAMMESLDTSVGRLRAKLTELDLAENTIIIFASDNGGHLPTTSNTPLRSGKGSAYEGGVRVPLIILWPGVTAPGSVSDVPTISTDFFPTLLEIAGLTPGPGEGADGVSLVPALRGGTGLAREAIYWHYPHYQLYQQGGTTPYGAIRAGDYKLIEYYDDLRVELYHLGDDIGETRDLAATKPEVAEKLRAQLHAWRKSVGAQMPTLNPAYDPSKPEYIKGERRPKEPFE